MTWIFAIALCCIGAELFLRLPIASATGLMMREGVVAGRVAASRRISDHWKERIMPVYARRMGKRTLVLTGWLGVLGAILVALIFLAETMAPDLSAVLASPSGIVLSLAASLLYFKVRPRLAGS